MTQVTFEFFARVFVFTNFTKVISMDLHMNKIVIYILTISFLLFSCSEKKKTPRVEDNNFSSNLLKGATGEELIKTHCYACHSPISPSHDAIIAPPMAAVKMRYSRIYATKDEFVDAVVSWTMDPKPEKSLMRGAVDKFKQMPKQEFKEDDMRKIATFIFDNKLQAPEWFAAHEKEMHATRGGMGQGTP